MREVNVKRREDFASEVNAVALLVGRESAQTIAQATKLAAVALADDVNEHYDELVQAAKIGARTAFRTRVAPRARADVCAGASTRAVHHAPLRHELGILGANLRVPEQKIGSVRNIPEHCSRGRLFGTDWNRAGTGNDRKPSNPS